MTEGRENKACRIEEIKQQEPAARNIWMKQENQKGNIFSRTTQLLMDHVATLISCCDK